jgi:hypothetical protein
MLSSTGIVLFTRRSWMRLLMAETTAMPDYVAMHLRQPK